MSADWRSMPHHPAASVFPLMSDSELDALAEDIRAHGLRQPLITFQGMLLDGRNRRKSCIAADVEATTEEWNGDGSPTAFVVSLNIHRRHLSESQRALAGARVMDLFKQEASDRQQAGRSSGAKTTNSKGERLRANLPASADGGEASGRESERRARDDAAAAVNVSPRSVEHGQTVLEDGDPELTEAVARGDIAVSTASTLTTLPKEEHVGRYGARRTHRSRRRRGIPRRNWRSCTRTSRSSRLAGLETAPN